MRGSLSSSKVSTASAESSSMFMMHDSGKDSTVKLEWKSSPEPFNFGSFRSVHLSSHRNLRHITPNRDSYDLVLERSNYGRHAPRRDDFFSDVFDPFSPSWSLSQVLNMMDQFIENLFLYASREIGTVVRHGSDVKETTDAAFLCVDMTGLGKEDVKISVDLTGCYYQITIKGFVYQLFNQMLERNVQKLLDVMFEGASVFDGSLFAAKNGCSDGITSFTLTAGMLYITYRFEPCT
ncbi:HSP20-like chaperone [Sesbania bispinosa]|nr:HSP20-like chaperone [Sesbania bispinosa]